MTKMEIKMDKNKIKKESKYSLEETYRMIDDVAKRYGITNKDKDGLFVGNGDNCDLAKFGNITLYLEEQLWFLPFVKTWFLYYDDTKENFAKHYKKKAGLI